VPVGGKNDNDMDAKLFRKRPVTIQAIQFDGKNSFIIEKWSDRQCFASPVLEPGPDNPSGSYMQIKTLEGVMIANPSDWIIRGVKGEYYPCKNYIFELTYEPVK